MIGVIVYNLILAAIIGVLFYFTKSWLPFLLIILAMLKKVDEKDKATEDMPK